MNAIFSPDTCLNSGTVSQRHAFEIIIILMLGGYLFIDSLNGFLVQNLGLPNLLSAGYKQAFLLLLLVFAFRFEPKRCVIATSILLLVFIWAILRFLLIDNLDSLYAFQEAIKVSYLFILVTILTRVSLLNHHAASRIFLFSTLVILFNIFSTLVGIGQNTYGDFGAKGFFYAGNAVSGVIVICASYFLVKQHQKSYVIFVLTSVFFMLLALLIGTKSGFLGVAIATIMVVMLYFDVRSLLLVSVIALLGAIGIFLFWDLIQQNPLYHRIVYFYQSGGIERVIFSGRDVKLNVVWPIISSGEIAPFLLGYDFKELSLGGVTRVEFDWIDMQINFGFVGSMIVYLGYLGLFFYLMSLPKNTMVNTAIISFVVLLLISIIAGHVMYNGMVTPLWAAVIAAAINSSFTENTSESQKDILHVD